MCDCFHLAFPNWHDASSGTGPGRRLRGPDPGGQDDSVCQEPSQFTEGERPRPQGSSPVEEYPETERFSDSDKEFETDRHGKKKQKKNRKSGWFEKSSTPKMGKLKEPQSPESEVIVKTAKDGCAEGLVYGGGGKDGLFIKEVVPESPASKSLSLREGDQILSATVYFDNVPYEDAVQILEHAQAYNVKLCLKRKPEITDTTIESDVIPEDETYHLQMRDKDKTKRRGDARISWPKFPTLGKGRKANFKRSHSSSEADEQRKLELSPTTSDTESPIKSQDALKGKKRNKMKLSYLKKTSRVSSSDGQETGYEIEETLEAASLESPLHEPQGGLVPKSPDKVELISTDIPSPTKSPDGKKKKKELKIKILGKDKSKSKASPKRLKTLGASLDIADGSKTEESDGTKLVEQESGKEQTDLSTVVLLEESPRKCKDKSKKKRSKDKTSPKFKLPKIGFVDYTTEPSQKSVKVDDQESVEKLGELSKDSFERTQLPKREDIEIPGMEDARNKGASVGINGNGEALQLAIDVNSVKEAVSKLPGYKLPQMDPDGVLIPEEILVIDANAQRISVKTPTKVADYNAKKLDVYSNDLASVDLSKNQDGQDMKTRKAKKGLSDFGIPGLDFGIKFQKPSRSMKAESTVVIQEETKLNQDISVKISPLTVLNGVEISTDGIEYIDSTGTPEREDQGKGLAVGINVESGVDHAIKLPKDGDEDFSDITADDVAVNKVDIKTPEKQEKGNWGFKMPSLNFSMPKFTGPGIDSSRSSAVLSEDQVEVKNNVTVDPKLEIQTSTMEITHAKEIDGQKGEFKKPTLEITIPKVSEETEVEIKLPDVEIKDQSVELGVKSHDIKIDAKCVTDSPSKFRMPKFKLPWLDVGLREADTGSTVSSVDINTEGQAAVDIVTPDDSTIDYTKMMDGKDINVGLPDVSLSIQLAKDLEVKVPEDKQVGMEVALSKSPDIAIDGKDSEMKLEGHIAKFKMPKFGIQMPKIKSQDDMSKTEKDVTLDLKMPDVEVKIEPSVEAEVKPPEVHDIAADCKVTVGHGKLKMPTLEIKMPKVEVTEKELNLSQKDSDLSLAKSEVKIELPDFEPKNLHADVKLKSPEIKVAAKNADDSSKFKMPKFKFPKLGMGSPSASIDVPDVDANAQIKMSDINIPEDGTVVQVVIPDIKVDDPSLELKTTGTTDGGRGSKFKMPHIGISAPKVKGPKIDLKLSESKADIEIPETGEIQGEAGILIPEQNVNIPEIDVEVKLAEEPDADGKQSEGGRFKLPKFGIKMPKVKAPEIDLNLSSKDKDLKVTEVDVEIPKVTLEKSTVEVEIKSPEIVSKSSDDSPSRYKMKKFKLPKFGGSSAKTSMGKTRESELEIDLNIPEIETDLRKVNVSIPASTDQKTESKGGLKMPVLGIKMPKIKAAELDLTKTMEVSLPETNASVELTDVKLIESTPTVGLKIDLEKDIKAMKDLEGPKVSVDLEIPEVGAKDLEGTVEIEGQGSRFKMPKFGFSKPKFKLPEMDLSIKKAEVEVENKVKDATLTAEIIVPEVKTEVNLPEAEINVPEANIQMKTLETGAKIEISNEYPSKFTLPSFKFPKFGVTSKTKVDVEIPDVETDIKNVGDVLEIQTIEPTLQISHPEIDLNLQKLNEQQMSLEVTGPGVGEELPSADLEIKAPELNIRVETAEGSPSKFWLPSFKLPKFGFGGTTTVPDKDHGEAIDNQEEVVEIIIEKDPPSIDITTNEVKGNVDVTLPMVKGEIELPSIDLKESVKGKNMSADIKAPTKDTKGYQFKMPTFKAPKIGLGTSSATIEQPDVEMSLKVDGAKEISVTAPALVDMETPAHELDIHVSKQDVDITLPTIKADIQLPEVETNVELKSPEIKALTKTTKGSPSKFKMPTFKLPRLGIGSHQVALDVDKVPTIDGNVDVVVECKPSTEIAVSGLEYEGKDIKVELPEVEIEAPDLKTSDEVVTVTLPQVDVQLPDIKLKEATGHVELKSSEINIESKESPSKFKMPTFKMPKFGVGFSSATVETPDKNLKINDKEVAVELGSGVPLEIHSSVSLETSKPEIKKHIEIKLPQLGTSVSEIKGANVDLNIPDKEVDISLPTVGIDVQLPDVEIKEPIKVEMKSPERKAVTLDATGSPSKFKMPTFKLPRLGIGSHQVALDVDKVPTIDGNVDVVVECKPSTDIAVAGLEYEGKDIKVELPEVEIEAPDLKTSDEVVAVTLPQVDVQLPDIKLKEATGHVELKSSEINIESKGSPSKFKMPTFKMPKFGVGFSSSTVETPDKNLKINDKEVAVELGSGVPLEIHSSVSLETSKPEIKKHIEINLPQLGTSVSEIKCANVDLNIPDKEVDISLPTVGIDVQLPDVEIKEPIKVEMKSPERKAVTLDATGSPSKFKIPSFKMPRFGIGTPSMTIEPPEVESKLSVDGNKDIEALSILPQRCDIGASIEIETTRPQLEGKEIKIEAQEVQLPEIELKEPSATVEIKSPEIKAVIKETKGSPSKFKMPSFKLPKIGISAPSATVELPEVDKSIKIQGTEEISIKAADICPEVTIKTTGLDHEKKEIDLHLPTMAIAAPRVEGPDMDVDPSKKGQLEMQVKAQVKSPEIKAVLKEDKSSPSKFKMPKFRLPKLGIGSANVGVPEVDPIVKINENEEVLSVSIVAPHSVICSSVGIDTSGPKFEKDNKMEQQVEISAPQVDVTLPKVDIGSESKVEFETTEIKVSTKDTKVSPSKFKMPTFKLPKIGISSSSATVPEVDNGLEIDGKGADVSVSISSPSITIGSIKTEHDGKEIKIEPSIQLKGPEVDIKPLKQEVNIEVPSVKSDIKLDTGMKDSTSKVEFETPAIRVVTKEPKGSPSKFKMPSFKLPKLGSPSVTMEVQKVEKKSEILVEPKEAVEIEVQMPKIDLSVEEAEIDLSVLNKDVDVTLPKIEAEHKIKLPTLDLSIDKAQDSSSDGTPATNLEDKIKKSRFSFPKFSFSKQTSKEFQVNVGQPTVDVSIAEGKVEVIQPSIEVKPVEMSAEVEGKDGKFKMPKLAVSLTKAKSSEGDLGDVTLPKVEVQLATTNVEAKTPEGIMGQNVMKKVEVDVKAQESKTPSIGFPVQGAEVQIPAVEAKVQSSEVDIPEAEVDSKLKRSNWTFPKFNFSRSGGKPHDDSHEETMEDLPVSKLDESKSCVEFSQIQTSEVTVVQPTELSIGLPKLEVDLKTPEIAIDVKTSEVELSRSPTTPESKVIETEAKDAGGSPFKFKMPSLKMSLFRGATSPTSAETSISETIVNGAQFEENILVTESNVDDSKMEKPKPETEISEKSIDAPVSPATPSKFQLPLFKMPTLSFSRQQPEEEFISVESKDDQLEIKIEPKSPKSTKLAFASMGGMLQNLTTEIEVSKEETVQEVSVETTKEVIEKQVEVKVMPKETTMESPKREWGGWFKFPTFGLSSPSEQRKSPTKEKEDEEVSPTSSIQSSDAFADISSTITSELTGLSPSSPTKVTVKYTDPDESLHRNVTTSTQRTQVISFEPMMAEKITNLSSGVSSSSEDTLRLESGKIHLLTSNIQATPESHHTKLITYVHEQSQGGFSVETEAGDSGAKYSESLRTGKMSFEKHSVQTRSSESKETIVITKQITRVFNPAAEPITQETATSIKQLKESVHSEKMKFFEKAKK